MPSIHYLIGDSFFEPGDGRGAGLIMGKLCVLKKHLFVFALLFSHITYSGNLICRAARATGETVDSTVDGALTLAMAPREITLSIALLPLAYFTGNPFQMMKKARKDALRKRSYRFFSKN